MSTKEPGRRIEEFTEEEIRPVEARMRDREFSTERFLGPRESLVARIASDQAALESLAIGPDQIADRLETVLGRAERAMTLRRPTTGIVGTVSAGEQFEVSWTVSCGSQFCPFDYRETERGCVACGASGSNFTIRNRVTGGMLFGPVLIVHLIRAHRFFEGVGLKYRVDPVHAVEVLELRPGVEYAPVFGEEWVWPLRSWSEAPPISLSRGWRWLWQAMKWGVPQTGEPGIEVHRQPDGGCVVHVAEGCGEHAVEFDGAMMQLDRSGIYTFESKRISRFVG